MQKTIVYVDGFNLYYRLLKQHPQYKWVDLKALAQTVLGPDYDIIKIRYFTADVTGKLDKEAPSRQKMYFNALETLDEISIHKGEFLFAQRWAGLVHPPKFKPEAA